MLRENWFLLGSVSAVAVALAYFASAGPGPAGQHHRDAPDVRDVRGHLSGNPPAALRPLTVRAGESVRVVGSPSTVEAPRLATVYAEVNGVPVVLSFEIAP